MKRTPSPVAAITNQITVLPAGYPLPRSVVSKIELPSGGWIELREPDTIRAGDQEDMMRGLPNPDKNRLYGAVVDMATGMKLLMITDWEIPYLSDPKALPQANPRLLRELTLADNRVLEKALEPARALLFPTNPSPDDDQLNDPGSPTMPASVSEPATRA